jgi:glycosyltransferase involved in cell wall biosynthesis
MAAGLPVVTTNVGGLSEAISDDVNGRLVPPLDNAALTEAIVDVLSDPAYAARLGTAARSRSLELFTTDRCVEAHLKAYEIALQEPVHERS